MTVARRDAATATSTITERSAIVGSHKVRTTIEPETVLTVDDAELVDLERLGVLIKSSVDEKKEK